MNKAVCARNLAKGSLKSGATIKESARIARASIKEYFAELEKFIRECPNGNIGSDGAIINAISASTALLITTINERLTATATLVGDATLIRHIQQEISEDLSDSQELFRSNLRAYWLKSNTQTASPYIEQIISLVEIVCFVLTVVFAILWIRNPSGNYEPLTVLFGLGCAAAELGRRYSSKTSYKITPKS